MKKQILSIAAMVLSLAVFTTNANAAAVTSLSGSAVTLPNVNSFTAGPVAVDSNITWSSTASWSVYGYNSGYGFANNGFWNGLTMVGLNTNDGTMTFAFDTPVSGFGGFLNWAPGYGNASIAAYDSSLNLIESTTINFSTNGQQNSGEFHGFLESSAIISRFTLSNAYIGGADFIVTSESVPEPATLAIMALGLLGLGATRRRK